MVSILEGCKIGRGEFRVGIPLNQQKRRQQPCLSRKFHRRLSGLRLFECQSSERPLERITQVERRIGYRERQCGIEFGWWRYQYRQLRVGCRKLVGELERGGACR